MFSRISCVHLWLTSYVGLSVLVIAGKGRGLDRCSSLSNGAKQVLNGIVIVFFYVSPVFFCFPCFQPLSKIIEGLCYTECCAGSHGKTKGACAASLFQEGILAWPTRVTAVLHRYLLGVPSNFPMHLVSDSFLCISKANTMSYIYTAGCELWGSCTVGISKQTWLYCSA